MKKLTTNAEIASVLLEMAALLAADDVAFKPRAYENAARAIEGMNEHVSDLLLQGGVQALEKIPGVGKGIAAHLAALVTGKPFPEYARLKKKLPVAIMELTRIEGIGPKMVKVLWQKLKIRNVTDLERAAAAGKISRLAHFGKKSQERIAQGITFLKQSGGRRILGFLLPEIRDLERAIRSFPGVKEAVVAGSVRRGKETIGDIDLLVASSAENSAGARFLQLPIIDHVYASGPTKILVRLKNGLDADVRIVPAASWGAALNYFTGSKEHNVALRELAIKRGWKLNEYGLFRGKTIIAGKNESELYRALGLSYIEPELRENTGEIEAARKRSLPRLVGYHDLRGDLQVQTDWTDGEASIEIMARSAKDAGLEYIAITDHTKSLAMTGGADEKKLLRQVAAIEKTNRSFARSGFTILTGAEVNILKDGRLDIDDEALGRLDVVGAAVHSHFHLSRDEQTRRVIRAMENPHVDILFHLTGRLINKREPIQLDVGEIIRAAKRTGTALEINAYPERLDIKDEYVRACMAAGVKMVIDSDAHAPQHFAYLECGIATARRGWADRASILNTKSREQLLAALKR